MIANESLAGAFSSRAWGGEWTIDSSIGSGGQGSTYLVVNPKGSTAVLKRLHEQYRTDAASRLRIKNEVAALIALDDGLGGHGYAPTVIIDGTDDADPYFIMSYIKGDTLEKCIGTGLNDITKCASIALRALTVIEALEGKGILHRDVKPKNIICRNGKIDDLVFVDFGLSICLNAHATLTMPDETMKNEFIWVPERTVIGGDKRDIRSDLATVVGIFLYALTGSAPMQLIDERNRSPLDRNRAKLHSLHSASRYPQTLAILDRGLKQNPDDRYQNPRELRRELEAIIAPEEPDVDLTAASRRITETIRSNDRKVQLAEAERLVRKKFGPHFDRVFEDIKAQIARGGLMAERIKDRHFLPLAAT